ncbi:hypothetical protein D2L64_00925 [Micromonospora radicis]|uniref:Uncharacterized protein n=2 Tax=Micromonospora radicis TaxID=1894971 RepID=A0A418N0P3_9ACTN|nr:hypothetical protein D2L64_00925 [Micromonospora radicis]
MILRRLGRSGATRSGADQLLDGARGPRNATPAADSPDRLAGLLRAAAAPAREPELAGEEAALAAFRAARQAAPAGPAPRPRRRPFTTGAVVWIAGVAATATAGAALAAVRLDRPDQPSVPPPVPVTVSPTPAPTGAGARPNGIGTSPSVGVTGLPDGVDGPSASGAGPVGGEPAATSPAPTPGLGEPDPDATVQVGPGNSSNTADRAGHCRAYLSKSERQREKALQTPAFNELVVAAGGAEHVLAYCQQLLTEVDPAWLAKHGPTPAPSATGDATS